MEIIFATGNAHKVTEAQKALGGNVTLIMPKELGIVEDIPENQLFPVAGVGFGAVLMKTEMLKKVKENGGRPFTPLREWGEDISFCKRAREAGYTLYTDSRVKVGHVGISIIDESTYESFRR